MVFFRDAAKNLRWAISEEQIHLFEMANLDPKETGFSRVIWVGPPDPRHGDRVKVINEPGRVDPADCISVSISDNPRIVAGKSRVPAKELNAIKAWIRLNKETLLKHAKHEMTDRQLRAQLKSADPL